MRARAMWLALVLASLVVVVGLTMRLRATQHALDRCESIFNGSFHSLPESTWPDPPHRGSR